MVAKSKAASLDATVYGKRAQVGPGWSKRMHAVHVIACCLCKAGRILSRERLIQCPDFYDVAPHSWRFQSRLTSTLSKCVIQPARDAIGSQTRWTYMRCKCIFLVLPSL